MEQETMTVQMPPATRPDRLGGVLFVLAVLALALSPTQLLLPGKPISAAEAVLCLAGLVWGIRWFFVRDTRSLPPATHWLVLLAGVLSFVSIAEQMQPLPTSLDALKAFAPLIKPYITYLAQIILYLLVGVTVFRAVFTTQRRVRTAIIAVLISTTLAVALGVGQRILLSREYQPDALERTVYHDFTPRAYLHAQTPLLVTSTFGFWNEKGFHPSRIAYADYLALLLPFALLLLADRRERRGLRVWLAVLLVGAAISVLAGVVVPALLIGLCATGIALGPRIGRATLIGVVAYLLLLAVIPGHNRTQVLQEPYQPRISAVEAANPNLQYEGRRHLKKIWAEEFAAVNLLRGTSLVMYPALFGVGAGQYQANIQEAYGGFDIVSIQRLESESQSGYLLAVVNTGIFGLAALFVLFGGYLKQAWRRAKARRDDPWAAAMLGAMIALVLLLCVTNPMVRGAFMLIAALLALVGNAETLAPEARITEEIVE